MAKITQQQKDKVWNKYTEAKGLENPNVSDYQAFDTKVNAVENGQVVSNLGSSNKPIAKASTNKWTGMDNGMTPNQTVNQNAVKMQEVKDQIAQDKIKYKSEYETGVMANPNAQPTTPEVKPQITTDLTAQKTETKPIVKPTTDTKPTTTTDITYNEDKNSYDPNKVISKAEQFKGSDGKNYQTVRNSDNTLTTIDVSTGQPVTSKYTDAERDNIKQSFLGTTPEQVKKTSNDYYGAISQGIEVSQQEKNTIEYKKAYQRKLNLDKFSNKSVSDLAYSIKDGEFLPGTEVYNDLKLQNPSLVADAEKLNSLNSINEPKSDVVDMQTKITEYITKMMSDSEKKDLGNSVANNPEIIKLNENLGESAKKLSELKDQLDYIKEDINKDYYGGGSKAYRNYIAGERTRELTRQYNSTLAEYNTIAGQIQTITEGIKYDNSQKQQDLQNMATALGMYQTITADQRALDTNAKQLEQGYQYQYGDLNSTNPTLQNIAIERAVNDLYIKYPLPGMESQAMKVAKVKERMAQGMSGQEAIASVEQEIRKSERYNNLINPPAEQMTPYQQAQIDLDNRKLDIASAGKTPTSSIENTNTTFSYLSKYAVGEKGGQCGAFVNKDPVAVANGIHFGDDYETEKANLINSNQGQIGAYAVWKPTGGDQKAGHTGIIIGESEDGTSWTIKDSNWNKDEKVLVHNVKKSSIEANGGYVIPGGNQGKQYTESDIELLSTLASMEPSARNTALKQNGLTLKDVTDYTNLAKQGKIPATSSQKASAKDILQTIKDLSVMPGLNGAIGPISTKLPTISGDTASAEIAIGNLISKLTLENLPLLKGPLSDNDIEFIKSASSNLNPKGGEKGFKDNLIKLYNLSARKYGVKEITKLSEIPAEITPTTPTNTEKGRWQG